MPLGYDLQLGIVNLNDTAPLVAYLVNDQDIQITASGIVSCAFDVQDPVGGHSGGPADAIDTDGTAHFKYNGTSLVGHYIAVATFHLIDLTTRSQRVMFEVQDPFEEPDDTPDSQEEAVAQGVWNKLSDCFDSSDGGPWLREMTLRVFNPARMTDFIAEAVTDFNLSQPPTQYTLNDFAASSDFVNAPNPMFPIIVEGTFLAVIRHLMRSYVEQPDPKGGEITYEDRRDYQLRWKQIYDVELEMYKKWLSMAKRGVFGFGQMSSSVYSYARSVYAPGFNRARGRFPWGSW